MRTNYKETVCSYDFKDKYTTSLIFASNIHAHVKYKNIMFSSTVTKQNNWIIYLNSNHIIRKHYDTFYFETTKSTQNEENNKILEDTITDYPKNIIYVYNQLTNDLSKQYDCIENKDDFKHQLCEYLLELYYDVENLDEIVEHENYSDVGLDEEPIIERNTVRNIIYNECKELFISFHQAEIDNKNKKSIITLENVLNEVPELHKIPHQFLCEEFDNYLNKNYNDLIEPYIYYRQSDMLYTIGMELYKSYQYYVFINSIENKIDNILSTIEVKNVNKDEIYFFFKTKYDKTNIPTDEEFIQSVTNFVDGYIKFYQLYNKFVFLFNTDNIKINLNDTTIPLFQKYDKEELPVDSKHLAEYEVYKYVTPYYRKHFFRKNSNKYKPVIEQLPNFISYVSSVFEILFKQNILVYNEDCIIYNEDGDIFSACEEIENIPTL